MSTELDRLKAWMAETGIKPAELAKRMNVGYPSINLILNDKRPVSDSFKYKFARRFGYVLARALFIDGISHAEREMHHNSDVLKRPMEYAARKAVANAILRGELSPVTDHRCHGCGNPAQQYHHPSYHPDDHLNVVPLCRSCHRQHHTGRKPLDLGVVPTSVGLVRIAIATAPEQP